MHVFIQLIAGYYLADFLTGIGHWIEDTYFDSETPYVGSIAIDNIIHHKDPKRMLQYSFLETISTTVYAMAPVYALLLLFGSTPVIHSMMFFIMFVNQIHKYSHMKQSELNPVIRALQRLYIIIPPHNHKSHHTSHFRTNYCIVHGQLNWLYDRIGLYTTMEYILERFGIHRIIGERSIDK